MAENASVEPDDSLGGSLDQEQPHTASGLNITSARRAQAPLEPGLYLVGTPIGNLEDITLRALRVLRNAALVACEDTRLTQKLLNFFAIPARTISCHEHNEWARMQELLALLKQGARVALVSDAGLPGISDPGTKLVRAAIEAGIKVIPVPGANAALTALIGSGLDAERFLFAGFLPAKTSERRAELGALSRQSLTLIFYEAPHRIVDTLRDVEGVWGAGARVAVGRELTKLNEEFLRGTVAEVRADLESRPRVRGEIVLLVEARPAEEPKPAGGIAERVAELTLAGGLDRKEALKRAARERGLSRSEAYRELQRGKR